MSKFARRNNIKTSETMTFFIGFAVPFVVILMPLAILTSMRKRKNKEGKSMLMPSIIGCVLLGLLTPILATVISVYGLSDSLQMNEPQCVTGAGVFAFFGYIISLFGVPLLGFVLSQSRLLNKGKFSV